MSESLPAIIFVNIPTIVEDAAINPISLIGIPRLEAYRGRVGDLDIVELRIAKNCYT